jgi:arylsulfatase A-like enzyme
VYTSDNGWMTGQHRLPGGKGVAYEEVSRMPLMVRGPNVPPGASLDHLVGNVDLAQTFAEWAGVTPPADCDGRSFAPLLAGTSVPPPEAWRQAYPMQYNSAPSSNPDKWPTWQGVRTRQYTYVEYDTGERELYDNTADPYQLNNLAQTADRSLVGELSTLTAQLNICRADDCRQLEDGTALPAAPHNR